MVQTVLTRPSTALSQRVVSSSTVANDTEAASPNPTPAAKRSGSASDWPADATTPGISRASTSPTRITGIARPVRRAGRSPVVAHDSSASTIGKVLKVSSASATGIRETAE